MVPPVLEVPQIWFLKIQSSIKLGIISVVIVFITLWCGWTKTRWSCSHCRSRRHHSRNFFKHYKNNSGSAADRPHQNVPDSDYPSSFLTEFWLKTLRIWNDFRNAACGGFLVSLGSLSRVRINCRFDYRTFPLGRRRPICAAIFLKWIYCEEWICYATTTLHFRTSFF